jgi:glycosyltransferase involved in cell wall biosynthesis
VWQVHEIVVRPRGMAWLFRMLPPLTADRVIAVSEAVRTHLTPMGRFRRRVVTVHNGLPDRASAPVADLRTEGRPLVAFVGRLNRWKGYDLFVEAVARIADRHATADFVIAGDAPPGEEWRTADLGQRLADAGLEGRVRTLGFVADGAAIADAADIVVVPSRWPDPFPTVVLEAMRAGTAVIASDHGGAPEMIADGVSGILVPPGDVVALADAIGRLIDAPEERARIGSAGRERVASRFTLQAMVDGVEQTYRDLE